MAGGRPTKYNPDFCDKLIDWMSEGMSFKSFAGEVDVCFDTLYEWEKQHPEFSDSKKRATAKCLVTWERIGLTGEMPTGTYCFNMKNRFPEDWKDRQEISQQTSHKVDSESVTTLANKLSEVLKLAGK